MVSPAFFACYLDPLVKRLREKRLGCHILGVWVGAALYADDIFLVAASRFALQQMVAECESYTREHNLEFSTDPCGQQEQVQVHHLPRHAAGGAAAPSHTEREKFAVVF